MDPAPQKPQEWMWGAMYYNVLYLLICSSFAAALINEYLKGPFSNDLLTLFGFSVLLVYQLNKRWITGCPERHDTYLQMEVA
jgi:hypothetical protein